MFAGNTVSTFIAVMAAAIAYCVLLFVTKTITRDEVLLLPKGKKLVKLVDKFVK